MENALSALGIAVNVEGDSLAQEGEVHRPTFLVKVLPGRGRSIAERR